MDFWKEPQYGVEMLIIMPCKAGMLVKLWSSGLLLSLPLRFSQPLKDPLMKPPNPRHERDLNGDLPLTHHFTDVSR